MCGQLGCDWEISVLHAAPEVGLGINLIPVVLLGVLWRYLKRQSHAADAADAANVLGAD